MVSKKKPAGAGFKRPTQRVRTGPQVGGMTKQFTDEEDKYFHARWLPQTQIFLKFVAQQSEKPMVFWQQQVLEAFVSIRPWEAHPERVRMEKVPAKETVQVLFRIGAVVGKVNDLSDELHVKPSVFVRAGLEWGMGWVPKVYQRVVGQPWQPEWNSIEYQMKAIAAAA